MLSVSIELDTLLNEMDGNTDHVPIHATDEWASGLFDPIFPEAALRLKNPQSGGEETMNLQGPQHGSTDHFEDVLSNESCGASPMQSAWVPLDVQPRRQSALMSDSSDCNDEAEEEEEEEEEETRRRSSPVNANAGGLYGHLEDLVWQALSAVHMCVPPFHIRLPPRVSRLSSTTQSLTPPCSLSMNLLSAGCRPKVRCDRSRRARAAFALAPSAQRRSRFPAAGHRAQCWRSERGWRRQMWEPDA